MSALLTFQSTHIANQDQSVMGRNFALAVACAQGTHKASTPSRELLRFLLPWTLGFRGTWISDEDSGAYSASPKHLNPHTQI